MVHEAVADTRVVAVNGARRVGRSTLVKSAPRSYPRSTARNLDVATERQAALSDPTRFVRHDGLLAIDDLIDRDVTQLAEIERRSELRRLLRLLAGSMAQPLNVERIASEVGFRATTTQRYISLLEEVFLIKRVDGRASSATGRAVWLRKRPRG
jgi:predicted AAA+ superfamily ATPase